MYDGVRSRACTSPRFLNDQKCGGVVGSERRVDSMALKGRRVGFQHVTRALSKNAVAGREELRDVDLRIQVRVKGHPVSDESPMSLRHCSECIWHARGPAAEAKPRKRRGVA